MTLTISLRRLGYRVAHRGLRVYWLVARPQLSGVKCALLDGDSVLLVRHTYGPACWDLPGGKIRRGEPPGTAARREIREELGIGVTAWTEIGEIQARTHHRRDTVHCFQARVGTPPLTLDFGELEAARWFDAGRIPPDRGELVDRIIALSDLERAT
ncbi:MAG TPA: NUDIX domain-containing protein [Solirubrobacteraceae bacterium]|jgi:8-oxo-dGTP pyrophosphatase MutT (NUDIX family)|nr:NUDIX domain-containing protein [Solirubrobacteraceae bacterium]